MNKRIFQRAVKSERFTCAFLVGFRDGFLWLGRIFSPAPSEPMDADVGKYWRRIGRYLQRAMDKEGVYDLLVRVHAPNESALRHLLAEHRNAPDKYQLLAELLKEQLQEEQKDRQANDAPEAPQDPGSRLSSISAGSTSQ